MKYKVDQQSTLHQKLCDLHKRRIDGMEITWALTKEIGATAYYTRKGSTLGEVLGFAFDQHPGPDWKVVPKAGYLPRKRNKNTKALWKKIDALPVIDDDELNRLLDYNWRQHLDGSRFMASPGWIYNEHIDVHLLSFYDYLAESYKPADGMIEITVSEYQQLTAEKS